MASFTKAKANFLSPVEIKRIQDLKTETLVENMDRCSFIFSKKQIIMSSPLINEFYTIKSKHPINDDNFSATITISCENPLVQIIPEKVTISKRNPQGMVQVRIQSATNLQSSELHQDTQYILDHRTVSKTYEFHKLLIKVPVYRLSVAFAEGAAFG